MRILLVILFLVLPITYDFSRSRDAQDQAAAIVGTRVSLVPPDGFAPSPQFPGYWQESNGSSIMVTEIPGPYTEVSKGFSSPAELAKRGMTLLNKRGINVNNRSGVLLQIGQRAYGTEYLKWILVFGDQNETVMVAATFPRELAGKLSEPLRASVLSTKWDSKKAAPVTEGLNFTFTESAGIKIAKRISNTLACTKSGAFPSKDVNDPLFVIGQSISRITIDDVEAFSKSRIFSTATVTGIEMEQSNQVVIDSLRGYEIVAKGKDIKSEEPMVIYQAILSEGQTYYIMQGLVSTRQKQTYLAAFKEMAGSFKRRKS